MRLYEQCADLLLHQWKVEDRAGCRIWSRPTFDFKDKRNLLLRVARAMQTSERGLAGNLIDEDTLERTLTDGLKGMPNLRPDRAARALIEQLRGRNFMLCSVGGRSYAFVHRTFLEYFCALEIGERFETYQTLTIEQLKTEIFAHWADESWHEVLCLLAGMIAPRFVAEVLAYLLKQPDPQQTCDAIFLAARCVGEVRKRNELGSITGEILDRVKALVRFDLNFVYDPYPSVEKRLRRAAIRMRAVQELARGWKEDPDTLPMLKQHASSDEDPAVRQAAVQELARGWKEDPGAQSLLSDLQSPKEQQ